MRDGARAAGLMIGILADATFGDPRRGHPVAAFGSLAAGLERRLYRDSRAAGTGYATVLVGGTVAAGVLLGTMMVSFIVALSHADVAFVLLFQALAPLGAALFSWLILREVFERDAIIASCAAIVGMAVMVSSGLDDGIGWAILIVGFIPLGLGMF